MTESRSELCFTYFANRSLSAGSFICLVTLCLYFISNVRVAASGAGVGGVAVLGTGRSGYNCLVFVTESRSELCLTYFTDGSIGAGSFGCLVTLCLYFIINVMVEAGGASVGGVAVLCASRSGYFSRVGVVDGCNGLLLDENFTASRAVLTLGKTDLCTGGFNAFIDYDGVLMFHGCGLLGIFRGSGCDLLVSANKDRKLADDFFTRCQCKQDQCGQGCQNERFEKSFHFSPSKNECLFSNITILWLYSAINSITSFFSFVKVFLDFLY